MNRLNDPIIPDNFFKYLMPLSVPIMLFGQVGSVIAIVWLIVLGAWTILIWGFVIALVIGFLLPYLLIPSSLVVVKTMESNDPTGSKMYMATIFSSIYVTIIASLICLLIMNLFIGLTDKEAIIPTLIWAYGTALFPFMRLTKQESQNGDGQSSMFTTFFIQLTFIIAIVTYYLGTDFKTVTLLFIIMLTILSLTYTIVTNETERKKNQY